MTQPNWRTAADALADVLAQENAALSKLDLKSAAALLPRKTIAAENFSAWSRPSKEAGCAELAQHLTTLATENRRLLNRALKAQTRVIGILANLVRQTPPAPRYTPFGRLQRPARPLTVTLMASV